MWQKNGIRINAVAPGFVDTQIIEWAREDDGLSKDFLRQIPARRVGRPEEIATTVLFLASPDTSYIVGAIGDRGRGLSAAVTRSVRESDAWLVKAG